MLELFYQEIIFNLVENNFFLIPGWIESTIFVMNTYVNVAFLRLLLSVVQLAKTDQHLEEELMFCAQANPLSQWGTYLPWINLLLHTSVWFTYDRLDVCLDIGDLLYGPQLLLSGERSGYLYTAICIYTAAHLPTFISWWWWCRDVFCQSHICDRSLLRKAKLPGLRIFII